MYFIGFSMKKTTYSFILIFHVYKVKHFIVAFGFYNMLFWDLTV